MLVDHKVLILVPGSTTSNVREPKSCLGRVFNSKLGHIATLLSKCMACMQTLLDLKTLPRVRPVNLSLSMLVLKKLIQSTFGIG